MQARVIQRLKRLLVFAVALVMISGIEWAATQEVPPVSEFPPPSELVRVETWTVPQQLPPPPALPRAEGWPGWQEFLAYREALRWFGGIILALMALVVLVHLAIYGAHHVRPTGRFVRRYSWKEVFLHDILAVSFVGAWASSTYLILAKYVLGYAEKGLAVPFGRFTSTLHIVSGVLFIVALIPLAVIWWRPMRFVSYDREWLKRLGGYFSRRDQILPAGHFNAGQKLWFYISLVSSILVAVSGLLIYYPALLGIRWGIFLYAAHTVLAVGLSAAVIVHVYMAVLAHPRSVRAMVTGKVDEACVREDHPLDALPQKGTAKG